jgi:hypothetical protein
MHEAATTNVHNPNVNGTSVPQSKGKTTTNGHQNTESKTTGRRSPQNYNNRLNNSGSSSDSKNPRRGKRNTYRNNNKMSGPSDSVTPNRQGGDDNRAFPTVTNNQVRGPSVPSPPSVKSWSNVVSSSYAQNGYQETHSPSPIKHQIETVHVPSNENNNKRSNRNNNNKKTGNRFEEKSNKNKSEEIDFNADAKIEAIQLQLDKELNDMQTKADHLKHLQEEIKTIKLERDGKIDELNTERANLIEQLQKLKTELSETENQISNINSTMGQLKMNKIQKIRSLEEHSRALLKDRAI